MDFRGFYHERIRVIRENPLNPRYINHLLGHELREGVVLVGDGFIRPEVRTFVNSGRVTSINAERGNLGTDKSVPYAFLRRPKTNPTHNPPNTTTHKTNANA
ncbi:MAG: hypothetical protein FWG87_04950 [Defluviitaleaceae bacterium]|nr:hypothetical protein [Defluviitaleaceae bacterium]